MNQLSGKELKLVDKESVERVTLLTAMLVYFKQREWEKPKIENFGLYSHPQTVGQMFRFGFAAK
ncbi:hypothetical protein ACVR1G_01365 [Streptococcus dentasini]